MTFYGVPAGYSGSVGGNDYIGHATPYIFSQSGAEDAADYIDPSAGVLFEGFVLGSTGTWTNGKSLGIACGKPGAAPCGEPIDLGSGNMFYQVEDYATAGQNPLSFTRYYNSMATPDTLATAMGRNWRTIFDRYLHIINPSAIYGVTVERPDGGVISFSSSSGVYTPDSDVDYSLTVSGSTWTLTGPDDTVETYTASGGVATLQTIKKRGGYTQTMHYTSGKLSSVTDSFSRSLGISYSSMGLLSGVTTPDTLALSYGYVNFSSANRLTSVSYNTSPATSQTYLYENASYPFALTGITDENGNRYATWAYDTSGRATSSQLAGGADLTQISYSSTSNDRTVTGPLGIAETYKFTMLQGVPKVTEIDRAANGTVAAATRLFTYDSNGYLQTATDWNGNQTAYTNNSHGLPTQIVYASGSTVAHTTTIAYDTTWVRLAKTITTPGITTVNTYDATSGMLTSRVLTDTTTQTVPYSTAGQTRTWSYSWTATGQLHTVRLPRTDVLPRTTFAYSGSKLTSITDPIGNVTTINTAKPGGLPLTVTDPNGVLTTLAYNTRNWLTSSVLTTGAGNLTTSINYGSAGNLTKTTLPDNSYLSYGYDNAHRLTSVADALSNTKTLTLDAAGDVTADIWKNNGGFTKWQRHATYDALGRALTDVDGASHTTSFTWDSQGNSLTVTDPLSHVNHQAFDALNRLKTFTDAATDLSQYAYDAHDRPLTVTDPKGNATSYVYDGFGEAIQVASPDTGTTVYHYDKDGNVSSKTDAAGVVTNFTYDANDRMLTRTYPADSTLNVAFTYDQTGHGDGIGRLTSLTDQAGSLSRSYDERGNITSDARTISGTTYTTTYTYDGASRIASINYPTGSWIVSYTRDAAGQVSTVKATQPGHSAVTLASVVKHYPFGPLVSLTWGNGVTDARSFDNAYRLLTLTDTGASAIQSLTYAYDADDNAKTINDAVTPANNQTLNYDILDRLSSGTGGYSTGAITYDSNSNRLSYGPTSYTEVARRIWTTA
jgi:YD repeat-containing protein